MSYMDRLKAEPQYQAMAQAGKAKIEAMVRMLDEGLTSPEDLGLSAISTAVWASLMASPAFQETADERMIEREDGGSNLLIHVGGMAIRVKFEVAGPSSTVPLPH